MLLLWRRLRGCLGDVMTRIVLKISIVSTLVCSLFRSSISRLMLFPLQHRQKQCNGLTQIQLETSLHHLVLILPLWWIEKLSYLEAVRAQPTMTPSTSSTLRLEVGPNLLSLLHVPLPGAHIQLFCIGGKYGCLVEEMG